MQGADRSEDEVSVSVARGLAGSQYGRVATDRVDPSGQPWEGDISALPNAVTTEGPEFSFIISAFYIMILWMYASVICVV